MPPEPATPDCPLCGLPPQLVISAHQAFCGNDDCDALMWDPARPAAEQLANPTVIPGLLRNDGEGPPTGGPDTAAR